MNGTAYFRFFIVLNLLYCNFLKFLMVTEEWNPAVRARSWIQLLWPKKPKLTNIELLSFAYYNFSASSFVLNCLRILFWIYVPRPSWSWTYFRLSEFKEKYLIVYLTLFGSQYFLSSTPKDGQNTQINEDRTKTKSLDHAIKVAININCEDLCILKHLHF